MTAQHADCQLSSRQHNVVFLLYVGLQMMSFPGVEAHGGTTGAEKESGKAENEIAPSGSVFAVLQAYATHVFAPTVRAYAAARGGDDKASMPILCHRSYAAVVITITFKYAIALLYGVHSLDFFSSRMYMISLLYHLKTIYALEPRVINHRNILQITMIIRSIGKRVFPRESNALSFFCKPTSIPPLPPPQPRSWTRGYQCSSGASQSWNRR